MSKKPTYEELEKTVNALTTKYANQKSLEHAFRDTQERLELAIEGANLAMWNWYVDTGRVEYSPRWAKILGYSPEEIEPHVSAWENLVHPEDMSRVMQKINENLEGVTSFYECEHRLKTKSGAYRWVLARGKVVERDNDGNPLRHTGTQFDINDRVMAQDALKKAHQALEHKVVERTSELLNANERLKKEIKERKQAENALQKSEKKYRLIAENTADLISILDMNLRFTYVSPASMRIRGFTAEEAMEQTLEQVLTPESVKVALGVFEEEMLQEASGTAHPDRSRILELEEYKKDGSTVWLEVNLSFLRDKDFKPVEILIVSRDITERKQAEKEKVELRSRLLQAQKMEAIGTLAGGIAHDFNNILFPLIGYSEMLREDLPADSPLQGHVDGIYNAALRSKILVKQILAFSRQNDQNLTAIKLQPIVQEALNLLRSSIPTTINIEQDIDPGCGIVVADPTQIHQVIMNLSTNAYHAMEENGGSLKIKLKQVQLDSEKPFFTEMLPGQYILLSVADTGIGIEKDIMNKIFDPYFTTKETGKGTGLGLSVVQGIVKNCNGDIRIYSEPGKGTEVQVYLPMMDQKDKETRTDRSEPIQGGIEKILLVDDEEAIVKMEQQMLERLGYRVTIRTGSVEALEAFKANPDSIDLIITDMTMPNMTGVQLAGEVRKIRSDIPIILCTGFSYNVDDEKSKELGIKGFVMKPVIMKEIADTIRNVLESVAKDD